ncbi:MAG: YbbR-like domain-containing protein [Lachnospiraceae bacterium]
MKKSLTKNIPLKIASVFIAVLVWFLVVNIADPIVSKTIADVEVTLENEAYIVSDGKMPMVEDGGDSISVRVTGKRSVIDDMEAADITATADLEQIISMDTSPIMVPITLTSSKLSANNMTPIPRNLSIDLDDITDQEFIISVVAKSDTSPASGYEVGTLTSDPEKITISGPKSLVSKIDKVVATIDVDGITSNTTKNVRLSIIDKNQDSISESQLKYLKYNTSDKQPQVNVTATVWEVRSDITLKANYQGTPAENYKVSDVIVTPEQVSVAGTEEALAQLSAEGNVITIPAEYVDISGATSDVETKIDLAKLLPDDLKLTSGTSESVIVQVNILTQNSEEYTISTKSITATNIPDGLTAVFETEKIKIRVQENGASLADLNTSDIKASVNLKDMEEGSVDVPVTIELPEGYALVGEATTTVKLSKSTVVTEAN